MTITITLSIPTLIMLIAEIALFIWAVTRDNTDRLLGSEREWAIFLWAVLSIIAWAIFGGIYWW